MRTMSLQPPVMLSETDREELRLMLASRTLAPGDVFRANLILMLADGRSYAEIQARLGTTAPTIARWKKRFTEHGIDGLLQSRQIGRKATVITPELKELVIAATCRRPPDGSSRWSCRALARELGLSKDIIQRIWRSEGLRPHRLERFMAADDKPPESGGVDIAGLFLKPSQRIAVFCHKKNSAVRSAGSSGTVVRGASQHGWSHDAPHGQLSLYMTLSAAPGHARSARMGRALRDECISFLCRVLAGHNDGTHFTVILDRLGREEVPRIELFLKEHPQVGLQLAPSHAAWLKRMEQWCAAGELLSNDSTRSAASRSFTRQLMWHIRAHSKTRKSLQWVSLEFSGQH